MKHLLLVMVVILSCSKKDRVDEVPVNFSIRNEASVAIAAVVYSTRTHPIGSTPIALTDVEFAQHQVNPGITKENVTGIDYLSGDGVYFQVYTRQDDINGLVYSRTYTSVELIRHKKLLVYQSP